MNCAICKYFFTLIVFSLKDYIILDEGHKIKNTATKTSKNLREIPAKYHFILTGTPVQNNLKVSLTVSISMDKNIVPLTSRPHFWYFLNVSKK